MSCHVTTNAGGSVSAPGNAWTMNFADVSFFTDRINNPANNAGFLLLNPNVGSVFTATIHTKENATANRPLLTLDVNVVPEPGTLGLLALGALLIVSHARRRRR